jgi:hypothetical protein
LFARADTIRFGQFRAALQRLAPLPSAELERLAADTLDCASHRLDAWLTSLASRRLDELRAGDGGSQVGSHLGAFGYVEDLRPRSTPASLGYLHAPSVAHATTAAVLRSGHLARGQDAGGVLALDLSSTRVALALELAEGVRRGQPIGALLGYRFERGLRDRRITLAQYILPLRQTAPLAAAAAGPDDGTPLEAIAARDVVDGLLLLRRWKADAAALYASLPVPVPTGDRTDIDAELARLDDALDALSDVLVAESVHQAVLGNTERSAAALDALDRQAPLPDIGVVRTPRRGRGVNHRLLVLLGSTDPAPGWQGRADGRSRAEPRLEAWAGALLGDPARYRFAAEVHDAGGAVVETLEAGLSDLGLSALATVCACASSGATGTTGIESRLALHLGRSVTAASAARLVLASDPPGGPSTDAGGPLGLRDLLELGAQILDLLASARLADQRALSVDAPPATAPPPTTPGSTSPASPGASGSAAGAVGAGSDTSRPDAGVDAAELQGRADGAVAALRSATAALEGALAADPPDPDVVATRLLELADAGQRAAVPTAGDAAGLSVQAGLALGNAQRLVAALDEDEAAFPRAATDPAGQVAHDLGRLRQVFGPGFPVLPTFSVAWGAELARSSADPDLLGDDPLAAATWLTRHALVRPAAARLAGCLEAVEMLGGAAGLDRLGVAQLPHRPGERWVALPVAGDGAPPAATTSIVAHSIGPIDFTARLAGLVVDQWSDVVPAEQETTGVSFHFDAPGARAPHAVLVAVPGDRRTPSWTVDALAGTVREAMALARMRALDADDLEGVGRFLPAIYLPFNLEAKTPSINLAAVIDRAIQIDNAAFLQAGS